MGTYGLDAVIRAWEQEQLTAEQAIGQILLLLQELGERLNAVERHLEEGRGRVRRPRRHK